MKYVIALLGAVLAIVGLSVEALFADWYALVGGTVVLTTFLKTLPQVKDFLAVVVSWGVGVILTVLGYFGELGFLVGVEVWQLILYAVSVSLAANGLYSAVKAVLIALGLIKPEVDL